MATPSPPAGTTPVASAARPTSSSWSTSTTTRSPTRSRSPTPSATTSGGVRLDTSERLVDRSLQGEPGAERLTGVNPELAEVVRRALDRAGHERVKIVASGGFDAEKIEAFERAGAPVDSYGVGSALLCGSFDFTADVVEVDGRPGAKVGRGLRPNPRLEPVA